MQEHIASNGVTPRNAVALFGALCLAITALAQPPAPPASSDAAFFAKTNDLFRVPYYMAAGETDIALNNGQKVMALFNQYGMRNFWVLSSGGHEWPNWRRYLHQTAQIMFPDCGGK
jgi:predicted esterase